MGVALTVGGCGTGCGRVWHWLWEGVALTVGGCGTDCGRGVNYRVRLISPVPHYESQEVSALSKYAKKILLSTKPAPVLESIYKGT